MITNPNIPEKISTTHVDNFIEDSTRQTYNERYARWVLSHMRLPAFIQLDFNQFMLSNKLFCTYNGKRYRVTSASSIGDIGLSRNLNKDNGYDVRVCVDDCSDWSRIP